MVATAGRRGHIIFMLLPLAALFFGAAVTELPPAPPRVTVLAVPGRDLCTLAYDQKRVELPASRQTELTDTLKAAQLDSLLAAHIKLRGALEGVKKADGLQDEAQKSTERENDRVAKQQAEVNRCEKQIDNTKQNLESARRRREDNNTIDNLQAAISAANGRLSSEKKQLSRAKEIQNLAEERAKDADGVVAKAQAAAKVAGGEFAKATALAEPGLK